MALDLSAAITDMGDQLGYRGVTSAHIGCSSGGMHELGPDATGLGSPEIVASCARWRNSWPELTEEHQPDHVIIMRYLPREPSPAYTGATSRCDPTYQIRYAQELRRDILDAHTTGATVHVTTAVHSRLPERDQRSENDRDTDCVNRITKLVAWLMPNTGYIDLAEWVCPNRECRTHHDDVELRPDKMHFTGAGANIVAEHLYNHLYTRPAP